MTTTHPLTAVLSELAHTLLSDDPVASLLDDLVRHAVELLPIDAAGVSLMSRGAHPHLVAGSDESALVWERLQSSLDEGPCRAAYRSEDPVLVPDLAAEDRFPRFVEQALAAGLRAAFALPMRSADRRVGAFDLYRSTPGDLSAHDLKVAQTLADVATIYLLHAEARSARTDFVASVSHELRTPVTSIVGYVELLVDESAEPLTPTQRGFLEAIERNSNRAAALASDLLAVASLESGRARPRRRVDLCVVARLAREALRPLLVKRVLDLDFDIQQEPLFVEGNADDLERALVNLVGNAVKFTSDGGWVRCTLRAHTTDGAPSAQITVSDNGLGIPDDEQPRLFSRFFRSSTAESRQIQGTGLGLFIVDAIVRQHGGRIDVRSEHLVGSTFTVDLPQAAPVGADDDHDARAAQERSNVSTGSHGPPT